MGDCPSCSGDSRQIAFRTLAIRECRSCGLVFAASADSIIECHEPFWRAASAHIEAQEIMARTLVAQRREMYEDRLGRPLQSILEIGCGYAAWGRAWDSIGCRYVGVEAVAEVAAAARERTGLNIIVGEFPDAIAGRFDVVFCSQVVEHLGDPKPFIRAAKEMADLVHIDVPNHASLTSTARKIIHRTQYGALQPPYHLRAYTPRSLSSLLRSEGLDVLECRAVANDDSVLGQLVVNPTPMHRIGYRVSEAIGRGSLLTAVARAHPANT